MGLEINTPRKGDNHYKIKFRGAAAVAAAALAAAATAAAATENYGKRWWYQRRHTRDRDPAQSGLREE